MLHVSTSSQPFLSFRFDPISARTPLKFHITWFFFCFASIIASLCKAFEAALPNISSGDLTWPPTSDLRISCFSGSTAPSGIIVRRPCFLLLEVHLIGGCRRQDIYQMRSVRSFASMGSVNSLSSRAGPRPPSRAARNAARCRMTTSDIMTAADVELNRMDSI